MPGLNKGSTRGQKKKDRHRVPHARNRGQMTSLDLPTTTHLTSVAADIVVAIDVEEVPVGPAIEDCASEMSFCDLAESVVPSDSASQVFSPRLACTGFSAMHMGLRRDDAFSAWKVECESEEAAARERLTNEQLVHVLLQQHEESQKMLRSAPDDKTGDLGMRHLVQSVRNIERSVANLHLHFGTAFPPNHGQGERRPNVLHPTALSADMQQAFHCNNNINAPNMNRQHATGGRGRGRRHANTLS